MSNETLWEELMEVSAYKKPIEQVNNFPAKLVWEFNDEYRNAIAAKYFEEFPRRKKEPSPEILLSKHGDIIQYVQEEFLLITAGEYQRRHERYQELLKYFLDIIPPVEVEPLSDSNLFVIDSCSTYNYLSQAVRKLRYAEGELISKKVLLEYFGYDAEISSTQDIAYLYANIPNYYMLALENRVPKEDRLLLEVLEYKTMWNTGVNPKVIYPFISGWGNIIDFVCDYRQLPAKEIAEKWMARNV